MILRRTCVFLSYLALAGVLLAPLLYFWDFIDKPTMKSVLTVTSVVWFVCGGIVRARALRSGS